MLLGHYLDSSKLLAVVQSGEQYLWGTMKEVDIFSSRQDQLPLSSKPPTSLCHPMHGLT